MRMTILFTLVAFGAALGITLMPLYETVESSSVLTENRSDERQCKGELIEYDDGQGECETTSTSTENAWESQ